MGKARLALFGLGTVGAEVVRLLTVHRDYYRERTGVEIEPVWAVVRDLAKPRAVSCPGLTVTDRAADALDDPEVSIVVEVMGGVGHAFKVVAEALERGKHVVTANKALLAERGPELFRLAHRAGRTIGFEASVAGGIPILAAVGESLAANRIVGLSGILNGTSNHILTAMHEGGLTYAAALAQAQAAGFAEADPALDVDGSDAAQKLAILCRLAFPAQVDAAAIRRQGIDTLDALDIRYARELGHVVKLLAQAQREGDELILRVGPTLVPRSHPMAVIRGEYNAVRVVGQPVGDAFFSGKGAGGPPTASSVLAGVLDVVTGRAERTFRALRLWEEPAGPRFAAAAFLRSRFYLRFTIEDQPGVLAAIAGELGRQGISIASVVQHEGDAAGEVPLLIMTHHASEGAVRAALAGADALPVVRRPTVCLPVAD